MAVALIGLVNSEEEVDKSFIEAQLDTFMLTEDNFDQTIMEFLDNPADTKPLLITLVTGECVTGVCVKFSKDIFKLAKVVKR